MIGVRKKTSNIVASEFIWKSYQKETVDSPKKNVYCIQWILLSSLKIGGSYVPLHKVGSY